MIIKSKKDNGFILEIFKANLNNDIGIIVEDTRGKKAMGISIDKKDWDKVVESLSKKEHP